VALLDSNDLVDSPSFARGPGQAATMRVDHRLKHRFDHVMTDAELVDTVTARLRDRLLPEVDRSLAHRPTSFETPKVVRYPAGGGRFEPHRDNASPDTAHRRLAVTVNLDCGYLGGELRFPEVGDERYRPRPGAAIVFSCGLLHEVTPVERCDRHALITFMW
jgi:predicted 2-oxoglutarate/Fe(II)-dependent dioxygenase YbiX